MGTPNGGGAAAAARAEQPTVTAAPARPRCPRAQLGAEGGCAALSEAGRSRCHLVMGTRERLPSAAVAVFSRRAGPPPVPEGRGEGRLLPESESVTGGRSRFVAGRGAGTAAGVIPDAHREGRGGVSCPGAVLEVTKPR